MKLNDIYLALFGLTNRYMHINIMSEFEKVHTHCHNGHVAVIYGFE